MQQELPKVSIIVAVFNGEQFLRACLDSLTGQTLASIEVIVVDDASTDRSVAVAEEVAAVDPRVKVIKLAENAGAFAARSAGLQHSSGQYLGFADCDDLAKPTMYEKLLQAIEDNQADIAICGAVEESGHRLLGYRARFGYSRVLTSGIFEAFCSGALGTNALWNKLYRRELILPYASLPLRWRQDIGEDAIANIGSFNDAQRVALLDETLYRHQVNTDSATRARDGLSIYIQTLRAYALALAHYRALDSDKLTLVTEMYGYRLTAIARYTSAYSLTSKQRRQVSEAVALAAELHPEGIPLLFNPDWNSLPATPSVRASLSSLTAGIRQLHRALLAVVLRRK